MPPNANSLLGRNPIRRTSSPNLSRPTGRLKTLRKRRTLRKRQALRKRRTLRNPGAAKPSQTIWPIDNRISRRTRRRRSHEKDRGLVRRRCHRLGRKTEKTTETETEKATGTKTKKVETETKKTTKTETKETGAALSKATTKTRRNRKTNDCDANCRAESETIAENPNPTRDGDRHSQFKSSHAF